MGYFTFGYSQVIIKIYSSECRPWDNEEEGVAMLWRILTSTLTVNAVMKKIRGRIPVLRTKTFQHVSFVWINPIAARSDFNTFI